MLTLTFDDRGLSLYQAQAENALGDIDRFADIARQGTDHSDETYHTIVGCLPRQRDEFRDVFQDILKHDLPYTRNEVTALFEYWAKSNIL